MAIAQKIGGRFLQLCNSIGNSADIVVRQDTFDVAVNFCKERVTNQNRRVIQAAQEIKLVWKVLWQHCKIVRIAANDNCKQADREVHPPSTSRNNSAMDI